MLLALRDVHDMHLVGDAELLEHDGHLAVIRRGPGMVSAFLRSSLVRIARSPIPGPDRDLCE